MGQDESRVVDADTAPQTLKARTLEALVQYIKDGRARKVVVMVNTYPSGDVEIGARLPNNTS